jgi:hypothetical protein
LSPIRVILPSYLEISPLLTMSSFFRKRHRRDDVTAATAQKLQSGGEAPMERAHYATPVAYIMRN